GNKETVTVKLPSGEAVDFVIPGGMSDAEAKTYVLSKRPDLFQAPGGQPPDAIAQARAQIAKPVLDRAAALDRPSAGQLIAGTSNVPPTPAQRAVISTVPAVLSGQFLGEAAGGLPKFIQTLASASGGGVGAGMGELATGASPKQALGTAAGTTAAG